jgi:hypothetical protein
LLCLTTTVTLIAVNIVLSCEVDAQLQSFPRQEITVGSRDGLQLNGTANTQTKADYKGRLDNSSDIEKVTYFSDGKSLNATLWLGDNVTKNPSTNGANTVVYGALIDVDNNPTTGKFGVDYQKEIQWTNETQQWNSFLAEYSSPNHFRILELQRNDSVVFEEDQKYIPVSFYLDSITSPQKYKVLYYSVVAYGNNSKIVVDLTGWLDIPPATYTFSTLPGPLTIRQGEQMDIGVQLKSSSGVPPNAVGFIPSTNYSGIKITFNPSNSSNMSSISSNMSPLSSNMSSISSPFFGIAPAPFTIEVPKDAQVGQYSIPVMVNISSGSLFPSKFINLLNYNLSVPNQGYISKQANLSLSVIEPPTLTEQVNEFWSTYGTLISLMGAGFAGALSTYLFDYLKNRKKSGAPIDNK